MHQRRNQKMIRRFNYTGRKKLPTEKVYLRLHRNGNVMTFDAQLLDLEKSGLPSSALVYVEAYHQATYMRFAFGTVGLIQAPEDRRLTAFYDGSPVNFRVKIVDSLGEAGRILSAADRLHPVRDDEDSKLSPLIPVRLVGGMGQEIWRVIWDAEGPVLELNQEKAGIKETLLQKHVFRSLLLPEILRTVLTRILVAQLDADEEFAECAKLWLKFVETIHPDKEPEERDFAHVEEWVNRVIQSFCSRHRYFETWCGAQQTPETS